MRLEKCTTRMQNRRVNLPKESENTDPDGGDGKYHVGGGDEGDEGVEENGEDDSEKGDGGNDAREDEEREEREEDNDGSPNGSPEGRWDLEVDHGDCFFRCYRWGRLVWVVAEVEEVPVSVRRDVGKGMVYDEELEMFGVGCQG